MAYPDSSALVKRYLAESDSDQFTDVWELPQTHSISVVGYAEVMAAFGRRRREGTVPEETYRILTSSFKEDWQSLNVLAISAHLNDIVERLTYRYPLRGFDSIHLASAIELRNILGEEVEFVSADDRLRLAAREEQFSVFPQVQP
jgi:predicted nucleic acid-binding protein